MDTINIQSLAWDDEAQTMVRAVVDGKTYFVPADPTNKHYAYILKNSLVIGPYVAPQAVVEQVTKYQFIKQLKAINKLAQVRAVITALANDHEARLEWDFNDNIKKAGPLVAAVKTELGLTDAQVNNFFTNAGAL